MHAGELRARDYAADLSWTLHTRLKNGTGKLFLGKDYGCGTVEGEEALQKSDGLRC